MNHEHQVSQPKGSAPQSPGRRVEGEDAILPLAEETVRVDKREVVSGRVRIRTVTREHEELVQQELARENVEVTRVRIDREVDTAPAIRQEDDVTIIPILEEIVVVETRLVLREEVHIRRTRFTEPVQTPVVLRKQQVVIDRLDADGTMITKGSKT